MAEHPSTVDSYYTFEQSHIMNLSNDDLSDPANQCEIKYCRIEKDQITLQLKSEKQNKLLIQSFPPSLDLNLFQPDLKENGEVVFADGLFIFLYFPYKTSLEVFQERVKIGSIKGKLKHKKVLKCDDTEMYIMVIDNQVIKVSINPLTNSVEASPFETEYSRVHDFTYQKAILYVLGVVSKNQQICISRYMTGAFNVVFHTSLAGSKLKFLDIAFENEFVVYNKEIIYYLSKKSSDELVVDRQMFIPLTTSSMITSALLMEDKQILIQDESKQVHIFSEKDFNKEMLLQEKSILGQLVTHNKDIYLAEAENGVLQFYKLQKVNLMNYVQQFNTFAELRPMKKVWLSNPETRNLFYKTYLRDHLDDIYNVEKVMNKIKNTQLKINLMKELTPATYDKLDSFFTQLRTNVIERSTDSNQSSQLKAIEEHKKRVSLFMKLSDNKYVKEEYANYKQKNILDLISQHIQDIKLFGFICSTYVNETRSYYDKILERVIESELEETPKGIGENCIERLLPLGKNYNDILRGRGQDELGTFREYWIDVRDQMKDGFADYSKDYMNYLKVIRICLTKFKKFAAPEVFSYICSIINCGRRRGVENLDFLYFDFHLRRSINLIPEEDYSLEQASAACSNVTFTTYIIKCGRDCSDLLRGIAKYYKELVKYIISKPVSTKEFFKLFEYYILGAKIKHFGEIIAELNLAKNTSKDAEEFSFLYENKPSIVDIVLKHIYTQENATHVDDVKDLFSLLSNFLGRSVEQYKDNFSILEKQIEIASVLKRYALYKYTFKEICRLSNLEQWRNYVDFISRLIGENISLADSGQLLLTLQKNIIQSYSSNTAKNVGLFNRDSWKECITCVTRLSVRIESNLLGNMQ